ncbi:MAG TPA: hypothetical protein DD643_06430 [Synechococcus sp. UBA8638]|nr:hypothetical protein [Synechococcus sp. UBA8638]
MVIILGALIYFISPVSDH